MWIALKAEEWEQKYQAGEAHWDHGAPSPGLVEFLHAHPELPKGRVVVPGCGTGHDVRAWARLGFQVMGVDIAPTAVRQAEQLTKGEGLSAAITLGDFLRDPPPENFDYLWEHTLFCAIDPAQRDQYVDAVVRWLKPGGMYLAVNYIVCGPDGPPWPVQADELWRRYRPHFHLLDQWIPRSYANRCGRELMSWWRRKQPRGRIGSA
ncbi:MAG: TPMT family class I SAM-dependent methyltransferase [Verrucomicrobia bacterium]|nr:TPMT family class I SAM-dependent methyltransferase [Verrucomicrobiota bacterium]